MRRFLNEYISREDGAVTVDWVVLTAAVAGLAFAGYYSIQDATGGLGSGVGSQLTSTSVD